MPKDEFDFEDPLELNGVALFTHEDTTNDMAEVFIEEFMRMGYSHKQILALFRNPQYLGPNLALQKRGEPFVRDTITEVFARWGKPVTWAEQSGTGFQPVSNTSETHEPVAIAENGDRLEACPTLTDPMGAPIPKLNL